MAVVTEGHGAQIKIGNGASSEVFTAIPKIDSGPSGPSLSPNIIEAYTHDSNSPSKMATYVNTGPVTFSILYDSSDTQHALLRTNAAAKTETNFQILLDDTGDEQLAFAAFITFEWSAEPGDFNKVNITLNINGDITIS